MLVLDAAGELDCEARADRKIGRRAMMALLVCAGVRVSELGGASREHVDLGNRKLYVPDAKTPSGVRKVDLTPRMVDELVAYLHGKHPDGRRGVAVPDDKREPSRQGQRLVWPWSVPARLRPAVGSRALPGRVTPAHPAPDLHQPAARGGGERSVRDGTGGARAPGYDAADLREVADATGRRSGRRSTR